MLITRKEAFKKSTNQYIKFVEISFGLIRHSRIPLYSSKFSKKIYTQHQLLTLLLLKEYLAEDYHNTIELTERCGIYPDLPKMTIHSDVIIKAGKAPLHCTNLLE